MTSSQNAGPAPVSIRAYPDGPLLVSGAFALEHADGSAVASVDPERAVIALCRCGRSRMAPLCDGSHTPRRARTG
ncbi:MAG: CDGSH iron-sulfur domain-containing protein [Acidimicrobiia bacterium]